MIPRTARLLVLLPLLALSPASHAQYKVVAPDGGVTYTDRPTATAGARVESLRMRATGQAPVEALPFALQQPTARFPVTLYTRANCTPCDRGRDYLRQRGIPYTEKSLATPRDGEAWSALGYGNEVPVLRVGQQVLRNFSQADWAADLDLAGYPATSQLPPAGYRGWQATPLAGAPPAPPPETRRADTPAALPPNLESTPNGIRF